MSEQVGLAILSAHVTPYRLSLHARIAKELPVALTSVFLGSGTDLKWDMEIPEAIGPWCVDGEEKAWSRSLLSGWRRSTQVLERLRSDGVRALVVNGYDRPTLLCVILRARAWGMKVFLRGDVNIRFERKLAWPLRKLKQLIVGGIVRRCDGVMPMGEFGRQWFAQYGAADERMFFVPYEPDLAAFRDVEPSEAEAMRKELGLSPERKAFCYLGRLVPFKRVDLLLAAFERVAADRPDWDLVVVGPGPEASWLQESVPEALRGRVQWVGFLDSGQARALLHVVDCLVIPSQAEAWGVVVEEAVAAGLVVVASDAVGSAREIVADGVTGRIFETGSAESLATALLDVSDVDSHARLRSAVPARHAEWKRRSDPVLGLRAALAHVGLLAPPSELP